MRKPAKLIIKIISEYTDYDIKLDDILARIDKTGQYPTTQLEKAPGVYLLTIEEKRPYKSPFWWLWAVLRFVAGSIMRGQVAYSLVQKCPQYLLFKGYIFLKDNTNIEFTNAGHNFTYDNKEYETQPLIKEIFNSEYFDIKYRVRLTLSLIISMLLLFTVFSALFLLLLSYAIKTNSEFGLILFSVLLFGSILSAIIQIIRILKLVNTTTDTYYKTI